MRSRGVNEFAHYVGPLWKTNTKIRTMLETNQDVTSMISSDYEPISPGYIYEEVEIPLPYSSSISPYGKDAWMLQEIGSISNYISSLRKMYNVLIDRDEYKFYQEYCPIRWSLFPGENIYDRLDDTFKFIPAYTLCYYALSDEAPRKFILKQAKKYNINPDMSAKVILWVRYDKLQKCKLGKEFLRYYKAAEERILKYGIPICSI